MVSSTGPSLGGVESGGNLQGDKRGGSSTCKDIKMRDPGHSVEMNTSHLAGASPLGVWKRVTQGLGSNIGLAQWSVTLTQQLFSRLECIKSLSHLFKFRLGRDSSKLEGRSVPSILIHLWKTVNMTRHIRKCARKETEHFSSERTRAGSLSGAWYC